MRSLEPSETFRRFEGEANLFEIQSRPAGGAYRFEAKQRMIDRADGFAIREAYSVRWWMLLMPGVLCRFFEGVKACDKRWAEADASPTFCTDPDSHDERHRAEICLNLYTRTVQQFTQRRLYTAAVAASVCAAVASVLAVALTVMSLNS